MSPPSVVQHPIVVDPLLPVSIRGVVLTFAEQVMAVLDFSIFCEHKLICRLRHRCPLVVNVPVMVSLVAEGAGSVP